MEKISVIIPVYNVANYLQQCLDSVYKQTYNNLEILCIYTKSTDDSYQILKSQSDSRLRIIRRDDGGLGGARNTGLINATGNFVFFLDSDDWIDEKAIELLYNKIIQEKSDFIMFPFYSYDSVSNKVLENEWGASLNLGNVRSPFSHIDLKDEYVISDKSIVVAWNKLYRIDFLKENNITFLENLRYEDNPFYYKCLIKAKRISYLDKKLLYYRINRKNSLQSTGYDNKNVLDIVLIMKEVFNIFMESKISNNVKKIMKAYVINEFVWRYELMNCNTYAYRNLIKTNFDKDFYNLFMNKIGINNKYLINIKRHGKNNKVKITIIIPVYKVEKYIEDCILSIINQSLQEIEIIFVDDNSPDDSIKIINDYIKIDRRICLFKTPKNQGAGAARNIGLSNAHGKYIIFMDPDDMFANDNILEKIYNVAQKGNYSTVCANIKVIGKNSHYKNYGDFQDYNGYNVKTNKIIKYSDYNVWSSWGFTRFMYSRDIIEKNKIRFPNVRNYEDPIFLINYMEHIDSIFQISDIIYLYRYIPKNSTAQVSTLNNIVNGMKILFKYYEKNKLYIHYANEYKNLINFLKYDYNELINSKTTDVIKVKRNINNLLKAINYKIIEDYYDGEVITDINSVKESKIKNIFNNFYKKIKVILKKIIIFFIKPIYSRLMNRVDNRIDDKIQDLKNKSLKNINALEKNMNIIKKLTLDLNKESIFLKKYIDYHTKYYNNIVKYDGSKIRVGILFQIPSFWPSIESLYLKFMENFSLFDVQFFLINNDKEKSQSNGAAEFLRKNKIDYIEAKIENIDEYKPHIILIQSPYDIWHRDIELYSENLFKKGYRIVYVPYGFEISNEPRSLELQYKLEFYNYCWKIYTLSDDVKQQYIENNSLLCNTVISTGLPRLDSIFNKNYTPIKENIIKNKKKNILLKLHFPLTMDYNGKKVITPDIDIYLKFLNSKYRRNEYNLYLMLHPKFFDEMTSYQKKQFDDAIVTSEAIVIKDADYREILYHLSAVISDRSGMLIEFAALNIPILYMVNKNGEEKISKAFEYLFNAFDKGTNEKQMFNFIDSVLKDIDSNFEHRNKAFKACVPYYDGKASERIIEDIKDSILKENK